MHPNWRALATLHIPLKRFVTEGACVEQPTSSSRKTYKVANVSSEEVKQFYEEVLNTPETVSKPVAYQPESVPTEPASPKIPFDKNKLFRAAMANDVETIHLFEYKADDINTTDSYGWTALMMAACEGAAEATRTLLELGANINHQDRSGNTAYSLAGKKSFSHIQQLLSGSQEEDMESDPDIDEDAVQEEFHCEICVQNFRETSLRDHITSTVHQFNQKSNKPTSVNRFSIPAKNRGLRIMLKQGWDKESGLGPTNSGRLFPVKTVIRRQRTGLGTKQDPAKVTHFKSYDPRAIKYVPPPKSKNRNDIRREKLRDWKRERRLRKALE